MTAIVLILVATLPLAALFFYGSHYDAPEHTLTFLDRHGELIGTLNPAFDGLQIWTPLTNIPASIVEATLKREDRAFYWHPGVNPWSILKAAIADIKAGRIVRGGSTITQQLAKNLIQEQNGKIMTRSFASKIKTTLVALALELRHPKSWILERYLNSVYYGHHCYGIAAAARYYFGTELNQLKADDIQTLTRLPQTPGRANQLVPNPKGKTTEMYGRHFMAMIQQRDANPSPGLTAILPPWGEGENKRNIVHTTLDLDLQKRIEDGLQNVLAPRLDNDPVVTAAGIVIDVKTGDVLALVGSRSYFDAKIDGQFNAAIALRQPGSTLKPFTYFAAFAKGMTPETLVNDAPINFSVTDSDDAYAPQNFDRLFHGSVTIREALANSYNVPAVEVLNRIGLSYYHDVLRNFGFTSLTAPPQHYGLAVTLGSGEVTLLELTNAYATLARHGYFKPTRFTADDPQIPAQEVLSNASAYAAEITQILADKNARLKTFGENGSLMMDGFDVAVKTGTSHDLHDNWTVGYSPEVAVGVWVGHADGSPLIDTTGATGAAPIWHSFMEATLRDKTPQHFAANKVLNHAPLHKRKDPFANDATQSWGITQPLNRSHYQIHPWLPEAHQKIPAEVALNGEHPLRLDWFLDDAWLAKSEINETDKTARTWILPEPGKHVLKIKSDDGTSRTVTFNVVENK